MIGAIFETIVNFKRHTPSLTWAALFLQNDSENVGLIVYSL